LTHDYTPPAVSPLADDTLRATLQATIDGKTKPRGALGELEALALRIGLLQRSTRPSFTDPQLMVFAGDHGLAVQGVSAYPSSVTWQMVENMLSGGAAVSVFGRQMGLALTVVDAGVAHEFAPRAGLVIAKVAAGTADASRGMAMTRAQCLQALRRGGEVLARRPGNAVLFGEMGIGNTSSATLLLSLLAGLPIDGLVGRGTGLDDVGLARKAEVLAATHARHAALRDPLDIAAATGGFEIVMMAGAMLQAAHERRLIVVDGYITGAAMLLARALCPAVTDYAVFAHEGAEPGHAALLRELDARPLLRLGLRLGEGSGAALAWPLVEAAARMLCEMASFASAGVDERSAR